MSNVRSAFKALSREQQTVVTDKRVTGGRSPDEWLALLGPVAEFDRQADAARHGGGGFWDRRFARRHDVPNGLRTFVLPLLPILREDHDPAHPLELTIDLTGAEQNAKQASTGQPYKQGAYHKIVDTFYDDPWLEGHARFADGADVRFAVIDHVRASKKTKRSASGKTKRKTKRKTKTELSVTVSLPARNYTAASDAQAIKATPDRTVVRRSRVVKPTTVDAVPDIGLLLELVAGAYDQVDPSRRKSL